MNSIGGYFELELQRGKEYHEHAVKLNTGRNALKYILKVKEYEKIYLPYYTCEVLLDSIKSLNIEHEFYFIDSNFEPLFDYQSLAQKDAFLYTNYFALKDEFIVSLFKKCPNLIVDNAQSFFSQPFPQTDTFYSARKFFGVPDGAYAYTRKNDDIWLEKDYSNERFIHLLKRIDCSAEAGFGDYLDCETKLNKRDMLSMSALTQALLKNINYESVAHIRKENYSYLRQHLDKYNEINTELLDIAQVPFAYPLLLNENKLRDNLIAQRIYVPRYWPNVLLWAPKNSIEYRLASYTIFLPIDQRYTLRDMERIVHNITQKI